MTANFEVPGDDESVTGVVSLAAEDDNGAVDAEAFQHIDTAAAGVLHQDEARDSVFVNCDAVNLPALFACEDRRVHNASVMRPRGVGNACDFRSGVFTDAE